MVIDFGIHAGSLFTLSAGTFTLPTGNGSAFTFVMPFDATVKSIYASFANYAAFTPPLGSSVFPFIVLATAPQGSNTFTLINATQAVASTPYIGTGTTIPANTVLFGSNTNINVVITAGTRVAICCAIMVTGNTTSQSYYFYYTGGILLS